MGLFRAKYHSKCVAPLTYVQALPTTSAIRLHNPWTKTVEGLTTIEQGRDQFDSMGGWVCFKVIMDPVDKADPAL